METYLYVMTTMVQQSLPSMPAVILCGGLSTRIGVDKSTMDHGHGPQWKWMKSILDDVFPEVFISCRSEQSALYKGTSIIQDQYYQIGPMGGIASIFQSINAESVFIVSCDLPRFESSVAIELLSTFDPSLAAICAKQVHHNFPEPLVAIWNRQSLNPLLKFIAQERYSLTKALSLLPHKELEVSAQVALSNVNTKEDLDGLLTS